MGIGSIGDGLAAMFNLRPIAEKRGWVCGGARASQVKIGFGVCKELGFGHNREQLQSKNLGFEKLSRKRVYGILSFGGSVHM